MAVVRSTPKLQKLLQDHKVSDATIAAHLIITEGNVKDVDAVSKALRPQGRVVDIIISGVGGAIKFTNPIKPTLDDPTICEAATSTILSALDADSDSKPLFVVVSTTGISKHGRDIPLAMMPLYHWMLAVPHKDKSKMEALLQSEMSGPHGAARIQGFVAVRPSLLTDGPRVGLGKVRAGTEDHGDANPAVGYTISRADVGGWIFEEVIENRSHGREQLTNKMVSITY
ncbi:MAG: hypothetical protein M1817_000837 [Caeruleum heppii]|nr:MAG: hypothetical protein M1817_000837 [Caeruleum heppii]